jgi:salicylate hydroxylase
MTSLIPLSTVKFNKRAKTIKQEGGKVAITFEDGEVVMAGTVIGCDGIKDLTRSVVLGPTHSDEVEATYAGKCAYRSIVPMKDAVEILGEHAGDAKMYLGSTVQMTTFPISKGTESNAVAFKMDDKPWTYKEWTEEVSREEMAADFAVGVDKRLVRLFDVSHFHY